MNNRVIKFVLLAHARSGSTLLTLALREHKSIRMFGELFHIDEEERKRAFHSAKSNVSTEEQLFRSEQRRSASYTETKDGATFLHEEIFCKNFNDEPFAVGFKLHYNHARDNLKAMTVWDYLSGNKDIYIIHLQRKNLLETILSRRIAFLTDEWERPAGTKGKVVYHDALILDPITCQSYFDEMVLSRQQILMDFAEHPLLGIEYEKDLYANFSSTIREVQNFLKVPYQPLPQLLEKQAKYGPKEQIANYEELKRFFYGTMYETFFV